MLSSRCCAPCCCQESTPDAGSSPNLTYKLGRLMEGRKRLGSRFSGVGFGVLSPGLGLEDNSFRFLGGLVRALGVGCKGLTSRNSRVNMVFWVFSLRSGYRALPKCKILQSEVHCRFNTLWTP